jgi:hypothetical protein
MAADPSDVSGVFGRWQAICLACRTALPAAAGCDRGGEHRVVDLMTLEGQAALLDEVWSGPDTVGPFGDVRPRGAAELALTAADPGAPARRGRAEGRAAPSPLGRLPCLAYALALLTGRPATARRDVLWQESAAVGFSVRLDDGALVRIPPGRVRLEIDRQRAYRPPRVHASEHLPAGLGIQIAGEPDFVPFDEALEEILQPGERVELLGEVELREDPTGEPRPPRAPAPTVLVPVGTPLLRRIG